MTTMTPPVPPRRREHISMDQWYAFLVIIPAILAIGVFVYGFIGWSVVVSLTDRNNLNLSQPAPFVGLENYYDVFRTARFQTNMRNLVVFTGLFLGSSLFMGLTLALMVDARIKAESFFRSVYIFPMALSFIVTGVVWQWMFAPGNWQNGDPTGLNLLFNKLGLPFLMRSWTADNAVVPSWSIAGLKTKIGIPSAMIPVVIAAVWQMSGYVMAMYLAGLRGIPDELREAARVDGATEWQLFRFITLPMLQPITLSAVIVLGHISLKIFDLVAVMTGGAPGNNTEIPGLYMYEITFKANKFSQGAAVATVMLIIVALLVVPYLRYSRAQEVER